MKKIVLVLLMALTMTSIYGQDTTVVSETERLIDKYTEVIDARVMALAQSLQQPAEHVYQILIKQQTVIAFVYLFLFLLSLICAYGIYKSATNKNCKFGEYATAADISVVVFSFLTFVFLIVSLLNTEAIMTGLINPEYGALRDIADWIK